MVRPPLEEAESFNCPSQTMNTAFEAWLSEKTTARPGSVTCIPISSRRCSELSVRLQKRRRPRCLHSIQLSEKWWPVGGIAYPLDQATSSQGRKLWKLVPNIG